MLSCRTKDEKLLCLKWRGSTSLANSAGFQTIKLRTEDAISSAASQKQGCLTIDAILQQSEGLTFGPGVPRTQHGPTLHSQPYHTCALGLYVSTARHVWQKHVHQVMRSRLRQERRRLVWASLLLGLVHRACRPVRASVRAAAGGARRHAHSQALCRAVTGLTILWSPVHVLEANTWPWSGLQPMRGGAHKALPAKTS